MPDPTPLQRVEDALRQAGVHIEGLASTLVDAAKDEDLNRRKLMSRTEAAFREGFLTGKRWPKFAPYATDVWRKSDFFARYFAQKSTSVEADHRYAKYNDLS